MTSLDRAKSFLRGNGKKLALAVVPLAAIAASAIPASAGTIQTNPFPTFAPGTVSVLSQSGNFNTMTATSTASSALPVFNGIRGVTDSGHFVQSSSGSGAVGFIVDFSGGGGGFIPSGGLSIPIGWSFTASTSLALKSASVGALGSGITWFMIVKLMTTGGTTTTTFPGMTPGSVPGSPGAVSGTGLAPINSGSIQGYDITLEIDWNSTQFGQKLTLDIPASSSIDINPASTVPEPSSLLLFAPGLGFLLLRRFRKKSTV